MLLEQFTHGRSSRHQDPQFHYQSAADDEVAVWLPASGEKSGDQLSKEFGKSGSCRRQNIVVTILKQNLPEIGNKTTTAMTTTHVAVSPKMKAAA